MDNPITARLVVMDTGPLITLATSDALDYLLYPGLPIYIPDAVLYEATIDSEKFGATAILEWVQSHPQTVQTVSTQVFFNYVSDLTLRPGRKERDLGERAALEAIHDAIALEPGERALLVTEDDRVLRQVLVVDAGLTERIIPITTRDLLEGLEKAQRIQSTDEIYRRAEDAGRLATQRRVLRDQHEQARAAVARVMEAQSATLPKAGESA
jgi:nucleotide-binding universal stress UspA family protein